MGFGAEGEVLVGVGAVEVELAGPLEHLRIPVRRADADEEVGPGRQLDAAECGRRRRATTPVHDRRVEALRRPACRSLHGTRLRAPAVAAGHATLVDARCESPKLSARFLDEANRGTYEAGRRAGT